MTDAGAVAAVRIVAFVGAPALLGAAEGLATADAAAAGLAAGLLAAAAGEAKVAAGKAELAAAGEADVAAVAAAGLVGAAAAGGAVAAAGAALGAGPQATRVLSSSPAEALANEEQERLEGRGPKRPERMALSLRESAAVGGPTVPLARPLPCMVVCIQLCAQVPVCSAVCRVRFLTRPRRPLALRSLPQSSWPAPNRAALDFHRRLPGYAATPLRQAPCVARRLGVASVLVKDESSRFGLPAFKILGASWAVYRILEHRLGRGFAAWSSLDDLRAQVRSLGSLTLVTATDGNHGRAVARVATWFGWSARIYVPRGTARARIEAIQREGARVLVVDGNYDDAVRRAASDQDQETVLVADTALTETDPVPAWVIEGYSTLFWEIEDALATGALRPPGLVAIQVGVGALAAAAIRHFRAPGRAAPPSLVGVEPERAACVLTSIEAGRRITLPGEQDSIMAGLNCGTPSPVAWALVSQGLDLFVAVEDELARCAIRALAADGIVAGESGAAGLAGLLAAVTGSHSDELRAALGLGRGASVLVLSTEGATDPDAYASIVASQPRHCAADECDD